MRAIAPELQELRNVVAAVIAPDGTLLEANAGFAVLAGRPVGATAAPCFALPTFEELTAAAPGEHGTLHDGVMKLRDGKGGTREVRGRVWRSAFGVCLLAEAVPEVPRTAPQEERHIIVEASLTDELTGVGNRARLFQALAMEVSRVQRTNLPLSACMAGMDGLGRINEQHGQAGGDAVLARFGFLLRLLTRPTDISTRTGDDRFVVLMPHTNLAQATMVAERIRKALSSDLVAPLDKPATASFGIAEFQPGDSAEAFLARAEAAALEAKAAGRNKVNASEPV